MNETNLNKVELSVVIPCLNEERTIVSCIEKALHAFAALGLTGEVIVADNASTDQSVYVSEAAGARIVPIVAKGYGSALMGGIAAAKGQYIIMGDADCSYDFGEIGGIVAQLRAGHDLVMGNRFKGGILPGAMPWHHRYIGNPVLSGIGRLFFTSQVGDFHCGLRGFTRDAYVRMKLQTTGMEFASEMVLKAALMKMKMTEVPIVLHPDKRDRPPHLRSFRDGWRHLKLLFLYAPRWLFFYPALLLFCTFFAASFFVEPPHQHLLLGIGASLLLPCFFLYQLAQLHLSKLIGIPVNNGSRLCYLEQFIIAGTLLLSIGIFTTSSLLVAGGFATLCAIELIFFGFLFYSMKRFGIMSKNEVLY